MQLRYKKNSFDFSNQHTDSIGVLTFIRGGLDDAMQEEFETLLAKIQHLVSSGENYHRIALLLAPDVFAWRSRVLQRMKDYHHDIVSESEKTLEFLQRIGSYSKIASEIVSLFKTAITVELDVIQQIALNTQIPMQQIVEEGISENITHNYQSRIKAIHEQYNSPEATFLERLLHSILAAQVGFYIAYLVYERGMEMLNKNQEMLLDFIAEQLSIVLRCEMFALNIDALASFHTLQENWDNNGANAPTAKSLETAQEWLSYTNLGELALNGGRVNTFPTRSGGIQIDIDGLENPLEIEISSEGAMELLAYNHNLDLISRHPLPHLPF